MNKATRKQIENIISILNEKKDEIDELQSDEEEKFDNMPEGLQDGEKGQAMSNASEALSSASESLDEAISSLEEAQG